MTCKIFELNIKNVLIAKYFRGVARIFPWGGPKYRFQNFGKCCFTNKYPCPGSKTYVLIYTCLDIVLVSHFTVILFEFVDGR